jgi:antitoxin ParD1/3/4
MPTQNVNVTDRIADFVQAQIKSGNFKNASEVHRAALVEMERREEERCAMLTWLRSEAQLGFDQIEAGDSTSFRNLDELDSWMDGVLVEVVAKGQSTGEANQDAELVS